MKKNIFLNLIILIFFGMYLIGAASLTHAASIESAIQKKYKQIKTIQTTFQQTLDHKESGSVQKRTGTLLFQKPFLVRWESKDPNPELLLIGDKVVWNYLPDEEIAYKYTPDIVESSRPLVQVITGQAQLNKDFSVKNLGKDGSYTKLHLYPHEPTPEMVEAFIWVDKNSIIRKASIIDFYNNSNTLHFTKVQTNVTFPKNTFSFTPPKGVDVESGMRKKD